MQAWLKIRRNQAIAGGLVVVLLGAGYFLTRGGGGPTTVAPITLPSQPGAGQPTATPSPRHHKTPKSTLVLTGRNPFQCIVCPPVPQSSSSPSPAPHSSPFVVTSNGLYTGGASTSVSGHSVTLLRTFRQQGVVHAHITVDANAYAPMVGQRFATNFELVSAGGGCARILYGDSSFTLCV
jgi:hypothetical protein